MQQCAIKVWSCYNLILDLKMMTDVAGNPEEERHTDYYYQPWASEAVCRYFYQKIQQKRAELDSVLGLKSSAWTMNFILFYFIWHELCMYSKFSDTLSYVLSWCCHCLTVNDPAFFTFFFVFIFAYVLSGDTFSRCLITRSDIWLIIENILMKVGKGYRRKHLKMARYVFAENPM